MPKLQTLLEIKVIHVLPSLRGTRASVERRGIKVQVVHQPILQVEGGHAMDILQILRKDNGAVILAG